MRVGGTFSGLTHVVAMTALLFGWPAFSLVFERPDDIDEPIDVLAYGESADFKAAFKVGALVLKKDDTGDSERTTGGIDPDNDSPTESTGDAGFSSTGDSTRTQSAAGRPDAVRPGRPNAPGRTQGDVQDDKADDRTRRGVDTPVPPKPRQSPPGTREIVVEVQLSRLADLRAPVPPRGAQTPTLAALAVQASSATAETPPPSPVQPPAPVRGSDATAQQATPAPATAAALTVTAAPATAAAPTADRTAPALAEPRLQVDAPAADRAAAAERTAEQPPTPVPAGTAAGEAAGEQVPHATTATTTESPSDAAPAAVAQARVAPVAVVAAGDPTASAAEARSPATTQASPRGAPTPRTTAPDATTSSAEARLESVAPPAQPQPVAPPPEQPAQVQTPVQAQQSTPAESVPASERRDAPKTSVRIDAPRADIERPLPERPRAPAAADVTVALADPVTPRQAPPPPPTDRPRAATVVDRPQTAQATERTETTQPPPSDPLSRLARVAAGEDEAIERLLVDSARGAPGTTPNAIPSPRSGELPLSGATLPVPGAAQATAGQSSRTDVVLREAAAAGNGKAALILAKRALRGEAPTIVAADLEGLLRRAAEHGQVEAQMLLAVLKAKGIVVAQDRIEAHALLKVAAVATGAVSDMASVLPPDPARPKSPEARAVEAALAQVERQMSIDEVVKSQQVESVYRRAIRAAPHGGTAGRFGQAATTEMLEAAAAGSTAQLAELLARGVDIEGRDTSGRTAIINAAWRGRVDAIELLVALGADFNVADTGGLTAVQWAASNGHTDAVERLVAAGAAIDARDNEGRTALMRAAWNGHAQTVAALLRAGANARRSDEAGETARDYALRSGNPDVVRLLGGS
ncbi:MAG: ankyrin repeat domain-containing protein [Alphaproteobacteria bacterium]